MKVFELHFNPEAREDLVIDSFIYEPENFYEKKLGNLYMAGELRNKFPQNAKFLNRLSSFIKKEFYDSPLKKNLETSFQDALKKANIFLDQEIKSGNVSWLGNLHFAVLEFNNFILNFSKTGNIKILLIRDDELLDLTQNLESQETEPDPLKVFENIVTGRLSPNDKIFILTKDIFSKFLQNEKLLDEFSRISDNKGLKTFFKTNKQLFYETSGVCLFLIVDEKYQLALREALDFGRQIPKFSLPQVKISLPRFSIPGKKTFLIPILILILAAGFFIFNDKKEEKINDEINLEIEKARSKIMMAENFLIFQDKEKAKSLFQEAWDILSQLQEPEAASLRTSIEKYLEKNNSAIR